MRKIVMIFCLSFVMGLIFSNVMANQIYEWTDKDGVKHFSNTPPVTEAAVKETREIPATYVEPSVVKSRPVHKSDSPPVKRRPSQNNEVELFSTTWCKYCTMARNYLNDNDIPFTEYDIEKDKAAAKRKMELSGRTGVPFAWINGKGVYGFSKSVYARALGLK